jgi:beta-galactosidase
MVRVAMVDNNQVQGQRSVPISRRTVLSTISGVTLGAALPLGTNAASVQDGSTPTDASVGFIPMPDTTTVGGQQSLNGTWDFTLASSDTPPTSTSAMTITPDYSSFGNDGILHNDPPVVTHPSKRAVDLAGNSYVAVGDADSLDFTAPGFTIQLTFKYSENTILFSKGNRQYSAGVYGGELSFWTEGDGNWPTAAGGDLTPGRWYTATFVADDSELRVYVDDTAVGSMSHSFSSMPSTDSPLHIGYNAGTNTHGSPVIDSFQIFDTALSADQIETGFNSVPENALAWLSFDSSSGGMVPDKSSTGNGGELVNDPSFVAGEGGQSLDLAGAGYVSAGSGSSLNFSSTGFTLQTTVRYDGGSGLVLDKGSSSVSSGTEQFGLGIYDGTVSFFMQTVDGNWPDALQTDISTGVWYRITVVVTDSESLLYIDGELVSSVSHGATGLASSDAPFVVGGNDLDITVNSTAAFDTALGSDRIADGFESVPDNAVLWLVYSEINDTSVEWREESVPGQWAYDDYYVPSGASEWYPPVGELGWYRREFEVPDEWSEGRLKLRFDSVYSHAWVYLNGTEVGEHVGGYTPFEIDITDAIDPDASNTLAVGVSQRSNADDMGWQNVTGGITRDVTLVGVPDVHLSERFVRTQLNENGESATVSIDATVTNTGSSAADSATVTVTLTDPMGETVGSTRAAVSSLSSDSSETVSVEIPVADPLLWNPEQPRLYTVTIEVSHNATERVSQEIGIRDVMVDGNELLINGTAVQLRGINWEEIHLPKHGQAIPKEITRQDARRLKEANVNYVRTAHHPTSEAFLDACDELGIVVEMEAPHMFIGRDRGDPYPDLVIQQTSEMVMRDRNRTSVCIWSIANESEWYDCFDKAARVVKQADPTRPTIFNHDIYNASDPWHDDYDLRAHHYPALRSGSTVEQYDDLSAPTLFDEYAHLYCYNDRELVTDPGLRDEWGRVLETIWERCRDSESVAGAAIWAGGDHLEQWGEYLWGMLDRHRRHRPAYWHVKKVYSPVRVTDVEWRGNGNVAKLTIENRHEFVSLAERSISFEGTRRGGRIPLDIPPGKSETVTLPVSDDRLGMTITHPMGYTIDRYEFTPDSPSINAPSKQAGSSISETDGILTATTDGLSLQIDRDSGEVEIRSLDDAVLVEDPELAITPTQQTAGREYESTISHQLSGRTVTDVRDGNHNLSITVQYDIAEGTFTFRPYENHLQIDYEFTLLESIAAREVGVALPTVADLHTLSWRREGLWSVYPDTHIGRQEGTASAFPDGSRPENEGIEIVSGQPWKDDTTMYGSNDFRSTKRNIRSAALTNGRGSGIRVLSDSGQHVRTQAFADAVDMLVLDRSISGTNAYDWMNRQPVLNQDPTLNAGETLQGSVTLRTASETETRT